MNPIKNILVGLLLALGLASSMNAYSVGTIVLRDKNNTICEINVPEPGQTVTIRMGSVPTCSGDWNNRTRSFRLVGLPSATKIVFLDFTTCEYKAPWFRLLTTKKLTNSSIIETQFAMTFPPGRFLDPGVQMDDRLEGGDNFTDQLSCLIIQTSPTAPPASPAPVTAP